jgi:hypothetical protein
MDLCFLRNDFVKPERSALCEAGEGEYDLQREQFPFVGITTHREAFVPYDLPKKTNSTKRGENFILSELVLFRIHLSLVPGIA